MHYDILNISFKIRGRCNIWFGIKTIHLSVRKHVFHRLCRALRTLIVSLFPFIFRSLCIRWHDVRQRNRTHKKTQTMIILLKQKQLIFTRLRHKRKKTQTGKIAIISHVHTHAYVLIVILLRGLISHTVSIRINKFRRIGYVSAANHLSLIYTLHRTPIRYLPIRQRMKKNRPTITHSTESAVCPSSK